jgi:D-glycerate 3-kinase
MNAEEPRTTFSYSSDQLTCCIEPLVRRIQGLHKNGTTVIAGIAGGQGTGKTTLAGYLAKKLSDEGNRVVSFSIDDFYTTNKSRQRLSAQYPGNPFYELPRGMPGTHRVSALYDALSRLKNGDDVDLPVFDKSANRGRGEVTGRVAVVRGRQDFVLFEGWCIGMPKTTSEEMIEACRRQHLSDFHPLPAPDDIMAVLSHLGPYQKIWKFIDFLVMLQPDSLGLHEKWRLDQEKELIARTGAGMSAEQVTNMVRRFLPFTCLCNDKCAPDLCIRINKGHDYYGLQG